MAARTFAAASLGLTLLLLAAPARAVEPDPDQPNLCPAPGGQSSPCANEGGCELNLYATACIEHVRDDPASRRCEIPCETGEGLGLAADPATCAAGETCVEGKATPGRRAYYCKASSFRVDLNVVDQCIVHFIEGLQPAFSDNACSLEANLSRLLDQTGDAVYDVFDLDLCILAFLEQPGCDPATGECAAEGLVPCLLDEDCGAGLYCSPERFTCQRDCGIVASREETFGALDRECMGRLKVCDYSRGRCERIDPTGLACAVDRDCPQGAYCLVGRCAPTCNRSIDCPGAEWYCAPNNRCRALPPVGAGEGQAIDPKSFAIRFARDELSLDAVQTSDSTGIVIMDLLTKRQVIDNPAASFGYRLEVKYSLKQDAQCSSVVALDCDDPTVRWAEIPWADGPAACRVRQADCVIDDTEEWIRLASPFGVVSASGAQRLQIHLEQAVADRLSAGRYGATVRAIYDNGDSDTIQVRLTKASPSGEYAGGVTVWRGAPSNSLTGDRPMAFSMRLELRDQVVVWNELMAANNLTAAAGAGEPASPLEDVTTGRLVRARIHGNGTLAYTRGNATKLAENEVPLVGIYVPDQSVIRLVGVIDIPGSFCFGENGSCATYDPDEVGVADPFMVLNLFGRPIRRQIQLQGPFDDAAARFHGVYRETISGLVPGGDLTLDGSFVLEQVMADGSVQTAADGPILKADATPVRFPVTRTVRDDVDAVADDQCRAAGVPGGDAQWVFQDRRHFRSYLGHATRPGIGPDGTVYARTTLFPDLVDFADHIADALAALSPETIAGRQQILNVFDFVADRLLPCDPTDPAPPAACIDEEAVRCGLALHQKAILRGWVNMDALRRAGGENDLFCLETVPTEGCPFMAGDRKDLFALQEHNRFWSSAAQIEKFAADRARSDAFLVMFRNEINPFAAGVALSYKGDKLREAVAGYDRVVKLVAGSPAASVLFAWPASGFKQSGRDWIKIFQTVASDRMDAIAELVDLRRRVFMNTGATDFLFARHLMQQEYLLHIYLMELQARWEGDLFAYAGEAGRALERGQSVVQQLDAERNALGITPDRVFFESTDPDVTNWRHYYGILAGEDGRGGKLAEVRAVVLDAVDELRAATSDLDSLEASLAAAQDSLDGSIEEICGPDGLGAVGSSGNRCLDRIKMDASAAGVSDALRNCMASGDCNREQLGCQDYTNMLSDVNSCTDMVLQFHDGLSDTCKLDRQTESVTVLGEERWCMGGAMGAVLDEKALVDLQRRQVVESVKRLAGAMQLEIEYFQRMMGAKYGTQTAIHILQIIIAIIETVEYIGLAAADFLDKSAEGVDCVLIAGLAFGTDCPTGAIAAATKVGAKTAAFTSALAVHKAISALNEIISILETVRDGIIDGLDFSRDMVASTREVEGLINEYALLVRTTMNLEAQISELQRQAQAAGEGYQAQVGYVADHLVGRETGSLLRGDHLVQEATREFRSLVDLAYKMAVAFVHHYNVPPTEAASLVNQALAATTTDDLGAFADLLAERAQDYCGAEAIDCDSSSNVGVLRYSLRERLFPNLRDIVDGSTGAVVTAGEQFHNLVTQPPWLQRRVRGPYVVDQIELPFGVLYGVMENTPDGQPRWLLDPLTCNHLLDARDPAAVEEDTGNVALNVVGHNLGDGSDALQYELIRGGTDLLRSCRMESVVEEIGTQPVLMYPIRTHLVGYAPQSEEAQRAEQPVFFSRSVPLPACLNAPEAAADLGEAPCWRFFGRDRSLASLDWKLVIPLFVDGVATANTWITGEGLAEDERPVMEDLVVYFRYRSRPVDD